MTTASDLMNPTLVALHTDDYSGFALDYLEHMGLHAAPVLDSDRKPVGVATRPDLAARPIRSKVATATHRRAFTVAAEATVQELAEACADTGLHHLVVVDGDGRAIGMISSIDVIRGLIGRKSRHLPMVEVFAGTVTLDDNWSPREWLTEAALDEVPQQPGLVVIRSAGNTEPMRLLRAARTADLREELRSFLTDPPELAVWSDGWGPAQFQWTTAV